VRMLKGKRSFSDGESSFVIFLGIRMQTLTSTKTPQAMQTERQVRMSKGKLGFTDRQGLIEQGVASSNCDWLGASTEILFIELCLVTCSLRRGGRAWSLRTY
jgi:hypothetical protein